MEHDTDTSDDYEWVEEDGACEPSSHVIRSEPDEGDPEPNWHLGVLDVLVISDRRHILRLHVLEQLSLDSGQLLLRDDADGGDGNA